MRVLLDTHAWLWFLNDDPQLSLLARDHIEDDGNEIWLSIASAWEIAIKIGVGKMSLPVPFEETFATQLQLHSITLLPIRIAHLNAVSQLPQHHRDPFDRLIIAQDQIENYSIISADAAFDAYDVTRLW